MTSQEKRAKAFKDWQLDLEERLARYLFDSPDYRIETTSADADRKPTEGKHV